MIDAGMLRLQEQGRMELSQIAGLTACYLPELYEAETYVCRRILSMADGNIPSLGESTIWSRKLRTGRASITRRSSAAPSAQRPPGSF